MVVLNDFAKEDLSCIPNIEEKLHIISLDIYKHMESEFGKLPNFSIPVIVLDESTPRILYDGLNYKELYDGFNSLILKCTDCKDLELYKCVKLATDTTSPGSFYETLNDVERITIDVLDNQESQPVELGLAKECARLFRKLGFSIDVFSDYNPSSNTIILYYNNTQVYEYYEGNYDHFIANLVFNMAREMYRARYYCSMPEQYLLEIKSAETVVEASADFYGFLYSLYRNDEYSKMVATSNYGLWETHRLSCLPRANALYYLHLQGKEKIGSPKSHDYVDYVTYGSLEKLKEVFIMSLRSVEDAYSSLIYYDETN